MIDKAYVQLEPDPASIDEIKSIVNELIEALEKANDLYNQLASKQDLQISISFVAKQD